MAELVTRIQPDQFTGTTYINGNFVARPVEWLGHGTDVSGLAGRTLRLVIRMRGTSLYALQFRD